MILAIEIGGTKLQVALVSADLGRVERIERDSVIAADGASGILHAIERMISAISSDANFQRVGIGFGGPVRQDGHVYKSHQIEGWDGFDLRGWCESRTGRPVVVANDCDAAALGEARWGAGVGCDSMLYVTVGTGVGGGWVLGGRRMGAARPAIAEIGHLRPGLGCETEHDTVESLASGGGIAQRVRATAKQWFMPSAAQPTAIPVPSLEAVSQAEREEARRWWESFPPDLPPDTRRIAEAAETGNAIARAVLRQATQTLGWALAQASTLIAPERIVIGGGVAKQSEHAFWSPVREAFRQYAFGPLRDHTEIVPSQLGDDVVLLGAAAVALESLHQG